MRTASHRSGESGIVLLTTLLMLMMVAALMAGFFAAVNSDVRATAIDRDQTQAYAAAHAGLEKLTSDLAQLFAADFSPSNDADPGAQRLSAGHLRIRVHGAGRARRAPATRWRSARSTSTATRAGGRQRQQHHERARTRA